MTADDVLIALRGLADEHGEVRQQRGCPLQDELARFLAAYNIPAGGIIYLSRQSKDTVRLFWRQAHTMIESVTVLEMRPDGKFDEVVIPAVEIPCEIAGYVFRAEKRFEDMDALFAEAIGKCINSASHASP